MKVKSATTGLLKRALPKRIKDSLLHLSFQLAPTEFEKFAHLYSFAPHMRFGLESIAARGFNPKTVIDVGAYQGKWSALASSIWPESRMIMVEPNPVWRCLKANGDFISALLGAEDGKEVDFQVMGSGSSVFDERSAVPRTVERRTLQRLDTAVSGVEAPIFLKIDAQGYELEILKGASRLLPQIAGILLEVAILEINQGAPLIHEVLAFMRDLDFVTYDVLEIHRRPLDGALNQVDILFVRDSSPLIADKRHFA